MKNYMPVLETERLIIKAGQIEDFVKVHEYDFNYLQNIDNVFEYVKMNPEEVRSWFPTNIEDFYKTIHDKKHFNFIVYTKDNKAIGDIGFDRINEELKSIEISCYLHPKYWGNGYMKEALIETMKYVYEQGFENIIYGYDENNERSKRLCKKIGFEPYKVYQKNNFQGNLSTVYETIMDKELFTNLYLHKAK